MRNSISRPVFLLLLCLLVGPIGCDTEQAAEVLTDLNTALSDLTQNRNLTEQFVRDCKSSIPPSDPAYAQTMEKYQDAREIYNRYLDTVEAGISPNADRSLATPTPRDVANVAADFMARATRSLVPYLNTRDIQFQDAVVIPNNLRTLVTHLPKKARTSIQSDFDPKVRWRKWSEI